MGKFIIECPNCGAPNQASDSFFSKNIIKCKCGHLINVKKDIMKSMTCPHCKNVVVCDQSLGTNAICPACKNKLMSDGDVNAMIKFHCPTCACELTADKNASSYTCPLCNTKIDVQEQIKKEEIKKNGLISVIKYEGESDALIWKHPLEDFNLGSQLIVHESQEAIFFKDGRALDTFGAGRHTLATSNIPLLKELYKLPSNNDEVFHSEIYFVNLATQMGIKWGTDSKVRMFDPVSGLHIEIGASGQFNIRVNNGRKLLLKLVGSSKGFNNNEIMGADYSLKETTGKFKALVITKVKSMLAKTIREHDINILEVDEHIEEISLILKNSINTVLDDYGLEMPEFYITSIMTPDDDPNFKKMKEQYAERYLLVQQERIKKAEAEAAQQRKIVEAQTTAQEEIIAAQARAEAYKIQAEAEAREMELKGFTYQQETQRQVATEAMRHQGNGGTAGDVTGVVNGMVGLGVGLGVMGEVVNSVKGAVNPAVDAGKTLGTTNEQTWECPNCHNKVTTPFCPQCGTKRPENVIDAWDCSCGQKGIMTPFCPICGKKRGE
ncbi:MAG: SPFH domain-containing protein [Erysipelotrichales bacterium]|nr:SPFH domain-containing protein [Erysipelotrichales bacterium]